MHGCRAPVTLMVVVLACAAMPATAQPTRPTTRIPDDPRFAQQWQLSHDGVMGAARAWGLARGAPVTVAIVDTGVDMTHRDLVANLWTNPHEVPGNGIDDDGDGHVDDVHGWDMIAGDADPSDDNGHGTSLAGVVAARGDNGIGVAGVAWRARIMPIKVVDAGASAPSAAIADGIRYAVAHGADIVLLALAGTDPGAYLQDAVRAASDAGVLVVCAAGNGGHDIDTAPEYPASFAFPNLVRVAATGRDGRLTKMSNLGPRTVDIAAAGDEILSTAMGGGYERRSGTSLAAATVAGAAALMSAAAPSLDAPTLRAVLLRTARHRHRLPIAGGTLDMARAMRRARALSSQG